MYITSSCPQPPKYPTRLGPRRVMVKEAWLVSSLVVSGELLPSSGVISSLLGLELAEDGPGEERGLGLLSCA